MTSVSSGLTSSIAIRCTKETKSGIWRPTGVCRLNCPAKRRSVRQRLPQDALGIGRVSPQQPRQPAHGAAFRRQRRPARARRAARAAASPVRRRARRPWPGLCGPSAIAITTPCSVCMSCLVGSIRVKMLRRLTSMVSRFSAGRRNSTLSSSRTRLSKNACIWCCEARLGALGHRERQRARGRQLEPFIADQQHRLRQVERGEAGIDRKGDDAVGERDLLVLQAVALAAEQDADRAAAGDVGHDLARRGFGRDHRLGLVMGPGGGGEQQRAVGDRLLDGVEQLDLVQNMVGAGGGAVGVRCSASRRAD